MTLWKVLTDLPLLAGDTLLTFLLYRSLTVLRPSSRQRWAYLIATPLLLAILQFVTPGGTLLELPLALTVHLLALVLLLQLAWPAALTLCSLSLLSLIGAKSLLAWAWPVDGWLPLTAAHLAAWLGQLAVVWLAELDNRRRTRPLNLQGLRRLPWPVLLLFLLAGGNYLAAKLVAESAPRLLAVSALLSLGLAGVGIGLFFASYRSLDQDQENAELRFYLQTIETLTLELRQFRHNYRNILHGLAGYIDHAEWDQLRQYFRDVVRSTEQAELNSYALALKNVTNYALFGLLSGKLQAARSQGVELDLNVIGVFGQTELSGTDLCQVLGAFLDNAVEAAAETTAGHVLVSLRYDGAYQQITVSNTCRQAPVMSRLNHAHYSTKGSDRGSGLFYAKRVLEKYPSVLHNTMLVDGEFRQELIIPIKQ